MRSTNLDRLTRTFTRDREYFDALMESQNRVAVARVLVYQKWARHFVPDIQAALVQIAKRRFVDSAPEVAEAWTALLTGGILKDVCLVSYLVVRGVLGEAGTVIRRALETTGVLTHFWLDPAKAQQLADSDSNGFKEAFVREVNKPRADALKASRASKRFAAYDHFGEAATSLYAIFSQGTVHGDTPTNVVLSIVGPEGVSCGFIDRPDPSGERTLDLIVAGVEMLCFELAALPGKYGKRHGVTPPRVGEAGRYLASLLGSDGASVQMNHEVEAVLRELDTA